MCKMEQSKVSFKLQGLILSWPTRLGLIIYICIIHFSKLYVSRNTFLRGHTQNLCFINIPDQKSTCIIYSSALYDEANSHTWHLVWIIVFVSLFIKCNDGRLLQLIIKKNGNTCRLVFKFFCLTSIQCLVNVFDC